MKNEVRDPSREKILLREGAIAAVRSDDVVTNLFYGNPVGPPRLEIASLVLLSVVLFISVVTLAHGYAASVDRFGDSGSYMSVASGIRRWDIRSIHVVEQFWGLPYAMAALSTLTGLSERASLLTLSLVPSLLAVIFAWSLWDGWVAGYFAILNFDWMQRTCLGGSEPLFVCLLLGAFLSVRRQRWWFASLLAAYATIVRPLGIFALIGIGLALLWKREYGRFSAALATGLTVGLLYLLPLKIYFGDPLANVHGYQGGSRPIFGLPFVAIIEGTSLSSTPWTNLVLSFGWIFFVLGATVAMVASRDFRKYFRTYAVEACFFFAYLWCLCTYNYTSWARGSFPRFSIPILPFVLLASYRWLPKRRPVLWGLGVISSLLAASSALGVVNVVHMLRSALG